MHIPCRHGRVPEANSFRSAITKSLIGYCDYSTFVLVRAKYPTSYGEVLCKPHPKEKLFFISDAILSPDLLPFRKPHGGQTAQRPDYKRQIPLQHVPIATQKDGSNHTCCVRFDFRLVLLCGGVTLVRMLLHYSILI
ncbi:hypothetical protein E4U54_004882 [Claviceps lovelessii]|nr:hypothetical protein E4U54_004882 [Claviceps lovelessii]